MEENNKNEELKEKDLEKDNKKKDNSNIKKWIIGCIIVGIIILKIVMGARGCSWKTNYISISRRRDANLCEARKKRENYMFIPGI